MSTPHRLATRPLRIAMHARHTHAHGRAGVNINIVHTSDGNPTTTTTKAPLVDVHTHVYLPRYAAELRARTTAPRILRLPLVGASGESEPEERLLILEGEPSGGRPVGKQYWDREEKVRFMDRHGIDISFVSSANPWLDFLPASRAGTLARELNEDLEDYCASSPSISVSPTPSPAAGLSQAQPVEAHPPLKRLYGFGLLPLVPSISPSSLLSTISQLSSLPHIRGVIMGTRGVGNGLDDAALEPVWEALARANLVVFLHPHYGVDAKAFGERDNGHVLPLALGFPFETTIAITRLILAGTLDRHPSLRILLAHSGGALPQLSSRLASCIDHDPIVASRLQHDARYYLGRLYYDAVAYGPEELRFVGEVVARASRYRREGAGATTGGGEDESFEGNSRSGRLLFGTDHPFFPPLNGTDKWKSVVDNLDAINQVSGWEDGEKEAVRGQNALRLFGLV